MALTVLAIPFLLFGIFVNPSTQQSQRCLNFGKEAYCFEQGSTMPETIKYGSVLVGFGLLFLGRQQIKRRRSGN
jgi:hypothetical protein